jgi:hypothetical protein
MTETYYKRPGQTLIIFYFYKNNRKKAAKFLMVTFDYSSTC